MPAGPWVLVVGMHRSGTSAITGALGHLGLAVPVEMDRWEVTQGNPDHWESAVLGLHDDALLERLGGAWDRPPEPGSWWESDPDLTGDQYGDPAVPASVAFPGTGPVVWKDPRVCLLLPYWLPRLPPPVAAVFIWRAPLAVAHSLEARDGTHLADGVALWERYNRAGLSGLGGVDTFVTRYESIVADPAGRLGELAAWLGSLPQLAAYATRWDVGAACASISPRMQHQREVDGSGLLLPEHWSLIEHLESLRGAHHPLRSSLPGEESPWTTALLADRRQAVFPARRRDADIDASGVRAAPEPATSRSSHTNGSSSRLRPSSNRWDSGPLRRLARLAGRKAAPPAG
jgi:hypothetical protein